MKVIVELDWNDTERARLVEFLRRWRRVTRLPQLARREDVRAFVTEAMANQWLYLEDQLAYLNEIEQATPPAQVRRQMDEARRRADEARRSAP